MNYEEALEYIHNTLRFGSKPGLERVALLLEKMGNPHKSLKFVHVAGTSGKGSTAAMLAACLEAAGYKTGLYISPFVERFNERIQINHQNISDDDLAELTSEVKEIIDTIQTDDPPTEFTIITALAMLHFFRKQVDIVVLEVGLGGRYDATNIIDFPEVAVITPLSLDHTEFLGSTVDKIAYEKGGIIKQGCDVVISSGQPEEGMEVLLSIAKEKKAVVHLANESDIETISMDLLGSEVVYKGCSYYVSLLGAHQIQNALTALTVIEILNGKGYSINSEAASTGLRDVKWNGRLEIISQKPLVLLDGAHNRAKISALISSVDSLLKEKRLVVAMGMSADKEYGFAVEELASRSDKFYALRANTHRALPAEKIAEVAQMHCKSVFLHDSMEEALTVALGELGDDDCLVVCGSLYLLGDAKKIILKTLVM